MRRWFRRSRCAKKSASCTSLRWMSTITRSRERSSSPRQDRTAQTRDRAAGAQRQRDRGFVLSGPDEGIYAAGKLGVYRDWVCALQKMDVLKLVDWTLSGAGLIKGERIIGVLRELIGDVAIEELPIPFTAVATDLDREREVWLTRGSLFDAIRASIAIPTIFRPHPFHGHRLVDGGLMNPLPLTPLLQSLSDYTVAVNVNAPPEALPPT